MSLFKGALEREHRPATGFDKTLAPPPPEVFGSAEAAAHVRHVAREHRLSERLDGALSGAREPRGRITS